MTPLEILTKAIQSRKPISYEYNSLGRAIGVRVGNPHAIFISTSENVNIDIFKTGGVSTDESKPLPAWRQYKVQQISNVIILENENEFETAPRYNPVSKQYARAIVKI